MLAFVLAVFGASGATTNVASIAALQSAINGAAGDDVFAGKQGDVLAAGDAELVGPVINLAHEDCGQ